MQSHTLYAHVGKDGILKLNMPIGITNMDVEVILILNPVGAEQSTTEWAPDFFTEVIGAWQGAPLIREPQGTYEFRSEFK